MRNRADPGLRPKDIGDENIPMRIYINLDATK